MLRVGLTGGIASGKSTVSALLADYGAVVIDSDLLAREAVAAGSTGLAAVLIAFGPDVLTEGGELDRPAMGRRVFGDDEARGRLEAIVHPRVRARAAEIEAAAPTDAVVVH
nr:dephospho-CoA kinase [Actinomycetota bacterium]